MLEIDIKNMMEHQFIRYLEVYNLWVKCQIEKLKTLFTFKLVKTNLVKLKN